MSAELTVEEAIEAVLNPLHGVLADVIDAWLHHYNDGPLIAAETDKLDLALRTIALAAVAEQSCYLEWNTEFCPPDERVTDCGECPVCEARLADPRKDGRG